MAKSASDTKLEDVLSSVRRLVSDELPRNERPKLPEGPGALVLTDKQRIESNAAVRIAGRTLEERIAELEAAVGEASNEDDFEPDGSEDQAEHRPDRIVYTRPPLPEESENAQRGTLRLSQIALVDSDPAKDDPDADSDVQLQFRRESKPRPEEETSDVAEAPMAEDVKEVPKAAEVHVFSSPDDEIARIEARLNGRPEPEKTPAPSADAAIVVPLEEPTEPASDTDNQPSEIDTQDAPEDRAAEAPADEDFDADLKAAVSSVDTAPEKSPDNSPESAPDTADETDARIAEAAIGAGVAEALGEDELRPLVAKLIREELQGELGERITRNVRKLVRREILRALAARDAE